MVLFGFILFIYTLMHHDVMIFHIMLIVKVLHYFSLVKYGARKDLSVYTELSSISLFPMPGKPQSPSMPLLLHFLGDPRESPMPDDAHSWMTLSICMPGGNTDIGSGRSTGDAFVFDMSHSLFPCDVHM
jgi:hypothetical protein